MTIIVPEKPVPLVECRTLYNQTKQIPVDRLIQRPSVYGLIIHNQHVLLIQSRHVHKYFLPGGGIEKGEINEAALTREVREETGIKIRVERFADFTTDFFYYDPLDLALHGFLFFYYCQPLTFDLLASDQVDDDDAEKPEWICINHLHEDQFMSHGQRIMRLLQSDVRTC